MATIERWPTTSTESAATGESIGVTLRDHIFIERGHIASREADAPVESNRVRAQGLLDRAEGLRVGARYRPKVVTQNVECEAVALGPVTDVATLHTAAFERSELRINDVGDVTLQTRAALVLDNHDPSGDRGFIPRYVCALKQTRLKRWSTFWHGYFRVCD